MTGIYGNGLQFWEYDNIGCGSGLCGPTFTLADNGNVGVGTTTPNYKLEVNGNVRGNTFYASGDYLHYPDYVFDPG